jgi:hypothetical protein
LQSRRSCRTWIYNNMSIQSRINILRSVIARRIQPNSATPPANAPPSPLPTSTRHNATAHPSASTFRTLSSAQTSQAYTTQTETREIVQQELQREAKDLRKDFISIFGLFAAFLTFTVLQIQALIQSTKISLIIGACALFVGTSLTFILSLHNMIHEKNSWKEFSRPIFIIILVIFFFAFQCFWYATHKGTLLFFS